MEQRRLVRSSSNWGVKDVEVAEGALMEDLSVPACTSEKAHDGGLLITEDPFGGRSV